MAGGSDCSPAYMDIPTVLEGLILKSLGTQPLVVGVSGCQGSGKTTLCAAMVRRLRAGGVSAIAISLDDFYLPRSAMQAVCRGSNKLLRHRGLPGTHDTALMARALLSLKHGRATKLPHFDKSLFGGAGDRAGYRAVAPPAVVLFEGWCVGFRHLGAEAIAAHRESAEDSTRKYRLADLAQVDSNLQQQYEPIWDLIDLLLYLKPRDFSYVLEWRLEQEHTLIRERGSGMTDAEIEAFVRQYMPMYDLYSDTVTADKTLMLLKNRASGAPENA